MLLVNKHIFLGVKFRHKPAVERHIASQYVGAHRKRAYLRYDGGQLFQLPAYKTYIFLLRPPFGLRKELPHHDMFKHFDSDLSFKRVFDIIPRACAHVVDAVFCFPAEKLFGF